MATEIPWWLNPQEVGKRSADWWLANPSWEDPTKSNGQALLESVLANINEGRPPDQPYRWNPIKDAVRRGMVAGATARGYTPEEATAALRAINLDPNKDYFAD